MENQMSEDQYVSTVIRTLRVKAQGPKSETMAVASVVEAAAIGSCLTSRPLVYGWHCCAFIARLQSGILESTPRCTNYHCRRCVVQLLQSVIAVACWDRLSRIVSSNPGAAQSGRSP